MFQEIPLKIPIYWYTWVMGLHIACTCILSHYDPCTSGNVPKNKIFWSFPQRVTNNLTISLPYAWKCSDSTLHFILKGYILSLLDALEEDNIWEQGNYSSLFPHSYMLESASLCPFEHTLLLFPGFSLSCKLSIEMEEWRGGGLGGGISFSISTRCGQRLSLVSLFIINRNIHFSSIVYV